MMSSVCRWRVLPRKTPVVRCSDAGFPEIPPTKPRSESQCFACPHASLLERANWAVQNDVPPLNSLPAAWLQNRDQAVECVQQDDHASAARVPLLFCLRAWNAANRHTPYIDVALPAAPRAARFCTFDTGVTSLPPWLQGTANPQRCDERTGAVTFPWRRSCTNECAEQDR